MDKVKAYLCATFEVVGVALVFALVVAAFLCLWLAPAWITYFVAGFFDVSETVRLCLAIAVFIGGTIAGAISRKKKE